MNIKRFPVIISDMRENMLFSKKWVYTACLHFTKYLNGVLHLICLLPFLPLPSDALPWMFYHPSSAISAANTVLTAIRTVLLFSALQFSITY